MQVIRRSRRVLSCPLKIPTDGVLNFFICDNACLLDLPANDDEIVHQVLHVAMGEIPDPGVLRERRLHRPVLPSPVLV